MLSTPIPTIAFPSELEILLLKAGERTHVEIETETVRTPSGSYEVKKRTLLDVTPTVPQGETSYMIHNFDRLLQTYVTDGPKGLYVDGQFKCEVIPCHLSGLIAGNEMEKAFNRCAHRVRSHLYAFETLNVYADGQSDVKCHLRVLTPEGVREEWDQRVRTPLYGSAIIPITMFWFNRPGLKSYAMAHPDALPVVEVTVTVIPNGAPEYVVKKEYEIDQRLHRGVDVTYLNAFNQVERLPFARFTRLSNPKREQAMIHGRAETVHIEENEQYELEAVLLSREEVNMFEDLLHSPTATLKLELEGSTLDQTSQESIECQVVEGSLKATRDPYGFARGTVKLAPASARREISTLNYNPI